ncbi:hypothetical protein A4L51_19990 [Salmonella enterica subsp. enterica serovar Newport]|nr:hypothetical protein [Salmonella enterica subsp. enterica serovar Newport]
MSNTIRYEITWSKCTKAESLFVHIDPEQCNFLTIFNLYRFCSDSAEQLSLEDAGFKFDLIAITLRALAEKCLNLTLANNWSTSQLLRYFEDNGHYMDGSEGIKIMRAPRAYINRSDMRITELP